MIKHAYVLLILICKVSHIPSGEQWRILQLGMDHTVVSRWCGCAGSRAAVAVMRVTH